eukprot:TRINITY_DN847_c0_g1_i2.p1 TRINITY_DN847_c0_g1~~TRINITY_DN847_c0_g1_i2.p1  ORF type:complete len:576 (+),score=217.27 TRINITY_DN847_c0_g1_i2:116-1843(+)
MVAARTAAAAALLLGLAVAQNVPSDFQADDWGVKACSNTQDLGCCCSNDKRQNQGATCTATELMLCAIKEWGDATDTALRTKNAKLQSNATQLWVIICGALVVFMQCGFAMLEAGSVRTRNTQNIIFKNVVDICIAALGFFSVGYAFAYGDGTKRGGDSGRFIGATNFFLMRENEDESGQYLWFFQFAFAATASTIVSGSVAERTKLNAYFIYSVVLTMFVYPVVVHWVWSNHGWLSAFAPGEENVGPNGMIDFAGSGVVHTVGGFAGLMGAIIVGPRHGRFEEDKDERTGKITYGEPKVMRGQSTMLSCLGAMILWFGWYGFNCGSTLAFDGFNAGKVAVTTTLAAGMGGLTTTFVGRIHLGYYPVDTGLNGILAGLVSITAGCVVVDEWCAIVIGLLGGLLYYGAAMLLLWLRIDDPLNAWPVHGVCGVWGCLAVGIFAQHKNIERAYSGLDGSAVASGEQFAVQLLGVVAIIGWTVGLSGIMFFCIDKTIGMRVSAEDEDQGLDVAEHAADPTATWVMRRRRYNPADAMAATMFSQGAHDVTGGVDYKIPQGVPGEEIAAAAVPTDADRQGQ